MKSELAAWLLQVLGEEKGRADAQARWADGWLDPEPRFGQSHGFVGPPVRPNHDQILADIEAKRALVANCVTWIEGEPENAWYDGGRPQDLADQTLRLLGSGYADRRGYRYEVEAQAMKRDLQPLPHSDHLVPHSDWGARERAGQGTRLSPHQQGEDMTQQRQIPDLPDTSWEANHPPKRSKLRMQLTITFVIAGVLIALVVVAGLLSSHPILTTPSTHTVLYEATADAAYGSGRTGMVTAQAPGGTTQRTGLLPITGTYTFSSGDFVYLSVQNGQGLGSVTCRITVDGVVVSENTSDGGYTIATCQGRVA